MMKTEPPSVRVRKLLGYWVVQRRVQHLNNEVWVYRASYTTWAVAFAVALVEADTEEWALGMECS